MRLFQEHEALPENAGRRFARVLFHAADAPPHGHHFKPQGEHYGDRFPYFPEGDGHGDPKRHVADLAGMGVDYYFVRIDSSTATYERMVAQECEWGCALCGCVGGREWGEWQCLGGGC